MLAVYLVMSSCSNLWGRKFGDSVVALSLAAGVLMIPARAQLEKAWATSTHDQITHPIVAHKKGRDFAAKRLGFLYSVTWGSSKSWGRHSAMEFGDDHFTMVIPKHKRRYGIYIFLAPCLPLLFFAPALHCWEISCDQASVLT